MTIEMKTIKITDITPSNYNPRLMTETEYNKLSKSIQEFGLVDPIIINLNNNHIIGGHQRYDILMEEYISNNTYETLHLIQLGEIGWAFPSTELEVQDLNHEKALNITLNKITGEWDTGKLEDLFNDLSIEGLNLELTGFDKLEIKNIFNNVDLSQSFDNYADEMDTFTDTSSETSSSTSSTSSSPRNNHKHICPECGYEWEED